MGWPFVLQGLFGNQQKYYRVTIVARKRILFSLFNRFLLVKFGKQFPIEVEKFTIRLGGRVYDIFENINE